MLEVMMSLGSYRFGLATAAYQELSRQAAWRWPTLEPIGALPLRQSVGRGDTTLNLSGTLYPTYKGMLGLPNLLARVPAAASALGTAAGVNSVLARFGVSPLTALGVSGTWTLQKLMADADTGRPLLLVDGRGRVWGYWVVLALEETESYHQADGAALKVAFRAQLGYYGDQADDAVTGTLMDGIRGILGI